MTFDATPGKSSNPALLQFAADIVSAYVSRNAVTAAELPALIAQTYANIVQLATGSLETAVEARKEPAVPIKKSVTNDFIICLEDGNKFKSLRRHLSTAYGMTPAEYRAKWSLPPDYPMVAPAYAAIRSELAKQAGLGNKSPNQAKKKLTKKAA